MLLCLSLCFRVTDSIVVNVPTYSLFTCMSIFCNCSYSGNKFFEVLSSHVGEEFRAGLGQALPTGSPTAVSRVEPYRATLRWTLLHPVVSYVSNAVSPPCPTLTSL